MRVRVITLKYQDGLEGFPGEALQKACSGENVLEVRDHFFMHGDIPHIALILVFGDGDAVHQRQTNTRRIPEDPSKDLPAHLQVLYRDLRQWRNDRAKQEQVPSYVIARNVQLVEICRRLPRSLAELREIEGIGESTCKKYGQDILGLIPADLIAEPPASEETGNIKEDPQK